MTVIIIIILSILPFAIMAVESLSERVDETEREVIRLADKSRKKALKRPLKRNLKYSTIGVQKK